MGCTFTCTKMTNRIEHLIKIITKNHVDDLPLCFRSCTEKAQGDNFPTIAKPQQKNDLMMHYALQF